MAQYMNGIKACTPGEKFLHLRELVGAPVEHIYFGTRFDTVKQRLKVGQIAGNKNDNNSVFVNRRHGKIIMDVLQSCARI